MIDITEKGDVAVVRFAGGLTPGNVSWLHHRNLVGLLREKTDKVKIAIDMSNVEFLDSSTLGKIVMVKKVVSGQGGVVALFGLSSLIENLVQLTRVDRLLPICASEEEALNTLSAQPA